jgi:tetratricopeptide (TPR) repeat protein
MQGEIPREGTLAFGDFAGLVRELVRRLADGRLDVLAGEVRRGVFIEAGQIRAISSELEDERLGRWLVSRALIEPHQMALTLLRQPDKMLYGKQLVAEGALEVERLQKELEERAVTLLSRMLFAEGSYWWLPGEKFTQDSLGFDMTTASLLAAALRAVTDLALIEQLARPDSYLWASQDTLLADQQVRLVPQEAYLLSRIDGTSTLHRLRQLVPMAPADFSRAVGALVVAGLVEVHSEPAGRPEQARPFEVTLPASARQPEEEEEEEQLQYTPEQQREFEDVVRLSAECRHRDYYNRLGLNRGASRDQIQSRFRDMARAFHPDRAQEPHLRPLRRELAEIYAALQESRDTLLDPERKKRYDESLRSRGPEGADFQEAERRRKARQELVQANVRRAHELMRVGDIGMAVQLLDQAVRLDPQPEILLTLAQLEFRNPMWAQRALDRLRRAVTVAPQCTEAWLELAKFWGQRGKTDKQQQCLEKIIDYDPRNVKAIAALDALITKRKAR